MNETIFALSTPVGGAITIMRISGPGTRDILERIFTESVSHRRVSVGRVVDEAGETVDTCCAAFFSAPHSYTGEDVAELSLHGSYAVARRVAELIANTGLARPAEAGEFTKRAYLNGKMDLAQAEAVMDMISANAERSRRAAMRQLEGRLSAVIRGLYERVKEAAARLAAEMDDESDETEGSPSCSEIRALEEETAELISGGMRSRILREGARVAIIGRPNVGKSSLLNALLNYERSIVTEIPGTTRDTVEESVSVDGLPVVFVDTAGLHDTEDPIERLGIERTKRERDDAELVLLLIDGSAGITPGDETLLEEALEKQRENGRRSLVVLTKADLEQMVSPDADGTLCGLRAICVSSLTGAGLTALREAVSEELAPGDAESVVTNGRHIAALEKAKTSLGAAAESAEAGETDIAFYELRAAMDAIASVLGREDPSEDLIDAVFAGFCIGK